MKGRRGLPAFFAALCIALVASPGCSEAADFDPVRVVDPFPPISSFPIVSAQEADDLLSDAELVLGVMIDGQSRAYPINMLTGPRREILNDTLAGHAIAATW